MSRTLNSSKHSSAASLASAAATGAIGSSPRNLAALAHLPPAVNARVNVGHEGVKMDPSLRGHGRRLEEQVHQEGLAAADRAVHVEPARRLARPGADQPAEGARPARRPIARELRRERVEALGEFRLRGVRLDPPASDQHAISRGDGAGRFGES